MNDHPNPSFLKYGCLFVIGVGVIDIVITIVDRGSIWKILWGCIRSAAYLYIGADMYRRSKPSR